MRKLFTSTDVRVTTFWFILFSFGTIASVYGLAAARSFDAAWSAAVFGLAALLLFYLVLREGQLTDD